MMSFIYATAINFQDTANNSNLAGSETTFAEWLARIFGGILGVSALLVLIYLIWGAISWITSNGDSGKVQKARDQMTQAIIGLIVLAASTAIFMLVQNALGIEILNITGGTTSSETRTTTGGSSARSSWGRTRPNGTLSE
ncbi:hypothetical protein KJZ63_03820 [Patescibacteria group bacterium]|nr:hypothetical protein [Patescibacteria group bacterium]